MATWKKVLVSGSSINAATLQVDNLNYAEVVVGGGTGSALYTIPINGTGSLLATTGSSGVSISGSFSGSFYGDGSGLTNLSLDGSKIATGSVTASVNVTGDLFKVQASSVQLLTIGESASFGVGVTASAGFYGTASWAVNANTASYVLPLSQSVVVSGSLLITGSVEVSGSLIAPDITGSLFGTASWAFNSVSASYASQSLTASFALTASGIEPAINNNVSGSLLFSTGTGKIEGAPSMSWDGAKLTVDGNAKITGDLIVQGTASFENQTSLVIADRFVLLASGSNSLTDGGIIIAKGGNSGSALYLESTSTGADGRWAVTAELDASASAATPDSFVVTAKINQSTTASGAPTWGGSTNGAGNIWITNDGDIYIYA